MGIIKRIRCYFLEKSLLRQINVMSEPMAKYRYFIYVNNIHLFIGNNLTIKKNKMLLDVMDYINPSSVTSMMLILSGKLRNLNLEIEKIGPVGDIVEVYKFTDAKITGFNILEKVYGNHIMFKDIRLKLKIGK